MKDKIIDIFNEERVNIEDYIKQLEYYKFKRVIDKKFYKQEKHTANAQLYITSKLLRKIFEIKRNDLK